MRTLALAAALLCCALTSPTWAQSKRPTLNLIEKLQLPQYCWGSRHGEPAKYGGLAQYSIPRACGKSMNHLCTGHVYLIAVQRISEKPRDKRFYEQKAVGEFQYTIRHMAPACPLRRQRSKGRLLQGRR